MILKEKEILLHQRIVGPSETARMVETIVGCKWSLTVFQLLALDINRPGEMVRSVEGLTTKVLNQCLKRNVEFGILEKRAYAEIPPRVEYHVTPLGLKFIAVLESLSQLQRDIDLDNVRWVPLPSMCQRFSSSAMMPSNK